MSTISTMIANELSKNIGVGEWLTPNYYDAPLNIGPIWEQMNSQRDKIFEFFRIVSRIAKDSLQNNDLELQRLFFSEAPAGMDVNYHQSLPDACWNPPILFRTDQSLSGKIYEIQAPGSGWGDLYLYASCLAKKGFSIPEEYFAFSHAYINNIRFATGKEEPKVYYMIDAASVPYSIRYMQAITRYDIKYWGLSSEVKMNSVDCVIGHSVISLTTSNYFQSYLQKAAEGSLVFAVPPNIIYDEKAIYVLPFHRKTKQYFDDSIRDMFPFTSVLENGGFYDETDKFVTIDEFCNKAKRSRKYYLKYGGPDTNRNWGSKTVHRLSGSDCRERLEEACKLAAKGEIWLIQKDVSKEIPEALSPDLANIVAEKNTIKLSGFYGLQCMFGVKVMARHHFKVHGQKDTFVGLGT